MTPHPSQYTDTGHDTPPRHSIQTQDTTPQPVTVYRHRADLSLCYPMMWNVTLGYTTTIWMSWVKPDRESPISRTHQWTLNFMMLLWWVASQKLGRKCTVPSGSCNRDLWCANPLRYLLSHSYYSTFQTFRQSTYS